MDIKNPFRNPTMRKGFSECVRAYFEAKGAIRRPDGSEGHGNSIATAFWRGFHGTNERQYADRASRNTLGYAYWMAGRAVAKAINENRSAA